MNPTPAQRVREHLRGRRDELVGLLQRLARAESPSTRPVAQERVLGIISGVLAELGYSVRRIPGRASGGHLYARPARRERHAPVQLLLGHCDTVWPVGTLEDMPVEDGGDVVRGPGVYDMKGGLRRWSSRSWRYGISA